MSKRPPPAVQRPDKPDQTLYVFGQKTMRRVGIEVISEREIHCEFCGNVSVQTRIEYRKEPRVRTMLLLAVLALLACGAYIWHQRVEMSSAQSFHAETRKR